MGYGWKSEFLRINVLIILENFCLGNRETARGMSLETFAARGNVLRSADDSGGAVVVGGGRGRRGKTESFVCEGGRCCLTSKLTRRGPAATFLSRCSPAASPAAL